MIGFSLQIIVGAVLNMSLSHEAEPEKKRQTMRTRASDKDSSLNFAAQAHSFEPSKLTDTFSFNHRTLTNI
jgi:hypothetical protein